LYPDNLKNPSDIFMRTYYISDLMTASYASKKNAYTVSQRVNAVDFGQQNDSQITMDNSGNMYVAWTSSAYNEIDVYARAYYLDGSSRLFNGSTSDSMINTVTPHKQWHPDIAVSPDGGRVLITWQSHDAEGNNYNTTTGEEMKDYGVCARLFTCASGVSINPVSGANKPDEWVVNTIHNGDQERPTCTVFSGASIRFVIAWVGPNTLIPTTIDDTASTITINGDDYDTSPGFYQVFLKYYPFTKFGMSTYTDQSINAVTTKALAQTYSLGNNDKSTSNTRGYYNPISNRSTITSSTTASTNPTEEEEDTTNLVLVGSSADDKLEITSSAKGLSIKLNDVTVSLASGVKTIQFSGMGGNDTIIINGSSANESIVVNGMGSSVKYDLYSGNNVLMSLSASGIQTVNLTSGGGNDNLSIVTTKGKNEVTFAPDAISMASSNGFSLTAANFKEAVVSSIVGTDVAYIKGSDDDEKLYLSNGYGQFVSGNCNYQFSGFATVEANGGGGNDFVRVNDVRQFNSIPLFVVANTDSTNHVLSGFEYVTLNGVSGAIGQIRGSKSDDALVAGQTSGRFTYSSGNVIEFNNVNSLTVDGNGGKDSAFLYTEGKQKSIFTGQEKTATMTQGLYSKTLNGFARVVVQGSAASTDIATLYDTSLSDTLTADGNSATLTSGKNDLYILLAFDQVTAKKDKSRGNDTLDISDAIDFVLEKSEWEKV
ncbi:MAG: hypothetical protein Q4G59_03795, partial [Planctomycetia bacterium]|nr:hypothetical protein [Planctomycetia bacterium]